MEQQLLDRKTQDKMGLQTFFESAGYVRFEKELQILMDGAVDAINSLEKKPVGLDSLAVLNFKLGDKAGIQKVLFVLQGLKAELEERNSPPRR